MIFELAHVSAPIRLNCHATPVLSNVRFTFVEPCCDLTLVNAEDEVDDSLEDTVAVLENSDDIVVDVFTGDASPVDNVPAMPNLKPFEIEFENARVKEVLSVRVDELVHPSTVVTMSEAASLGYPAIDQ